MTAASRNPARRTNRVFVRPFACLSIALTAVAVASPPAIAQAPEPALHGHHADLPPRLSVSASAYRDVVQDRITVTLYVERESPQPAAGQAQVSELLGLVIERLKSDPQLEVQGSGYRTDPVWQQSRIVGWRTRGSIQVASAPSDAFHRLIGELAGRLNIESVAYSLSRRARLAVEQELIAEAVSAFRSKAETATRALGFRSYSVRNVSVDGAAPIRPEPAPTMMMSRAAGAEAAQVPLPAAEGKTTVTLTVGGTVALER